MKRFCMTALWIFIVTLSRLLPHPANVTPCTNLCLLAGNQLNKATAFISTILALILSDLLLSQINGHSIFGSWSWFTYSGFIMAMLIGNLLRNKINKKTLLPVILSVSIFYWLWTNFGTWLTTSIYAKTWTGLITCYIAALPFLRNSLLGDFGWMLIIWGIYYIVSSPRRRESSTLSLRTSVMNHHQVTAGDPSFHSRRQKNGFPPLNQCLGEVSRKRQNLIPN